ncbi:HlyD family secretion protein [Rubinisphaera sp. JC750]|uniref:HlyD family secretion protein n=1 Tax=Rubinisphaera sp. JC750 TaxID=2898658 RepID=UPI0028F43059|nr:efflux RND transporter periplasmic adaptor subunit [Rubinisphaera sp. JC750]
MIIFLTLLYVALLFLLKWLKAIRFNLFWTISPLLWFLLLNVTLFIPMQWGAPAGPVAVFRQVVEIVPAVSGQVTEVPVKPLTKVNAGDVLFQIDPAPFEDEVRRLEAALVDAQQQPELLASDVKVAEAALAKAEAEQTRAQTELDRAVGLHQKQVITDDQLQGYQRDTTVADRAVDQGQAQLDQAKLRLAAIAADGENTAIVQAREQLARAQYDLDHATVRAPSDGVVQQLALQPGTRVAALPMRSAIAFVDQTNTRIAVAIQQNQLRYVKPGQTAEIVLKHYPGRTFRAKVEGVTAVTSGGQVQSSGVVEDLSAKQTRAEPFQVVLTWDDDRVDAANLRGGTVGKAAIYTEHVQVTHVIRRVMMRMQAWINYLF